MCAFPYPLADECAIQLTVPAEVPLTLKAWELLLPRTPDQDNPDPNAFTFPPDLGPGYFALLWDGNATFKPDAKTPTGACDWMDRYFEIKGGTKVTLVEDGASARVAVLAVANFERGASEPNLPSKGACGVTTLPVPDDPNAPNLTCIMRVLEPADKPRDPDDWRLTLEQWPRPAFVLSMLGGPGAGDPCELSEIHRQNDEDELDIATIAEGVGTRLRLAREPDDPNKGQPLNRAVLFDFYTPGDPVESRSTASEGRYEVVAGVEQGCRLRCWGG